MEKKVFKTFVKAGHKLSGNEFVLGRIIGIKYVICDTDGLKDLDGLSYAFVRTESGCILTTKCAPEHYAAFKKVMEYNYPGLCIFNYEEHKTED